MISNLEQIKRSIQKLPAPEQDKILQWLEEKKDSNGSTANGSIGNRHSDESLRWLNENRQEYLGKWIALDGGRLIATGSSAVEVYNNAKEAGVQIPFVELVTEEESIPFTGDWIS